ncbi:MAG: F0F1 ATP synthase subunit alpha [Patescibacteria group bacterium]|nr:F0F1 ATP synthase subunit alpha [Patescibacteria group bacterium]
MEKDFILEALKRQIEGADLSVKGEEIGRVVSVVDGIVYIEGLPNVMSSELVLIERSRGDNKKDATPALVLNLEEYAVGAVVLGDDTLIQEGDVVRRTEKVLSVPVGSQLLGRVVNSLGVPLDGKGSIKGENMQLSPIERSAPSVIDREPVSTPLNTGIKVIDATIPIGRGQRELIIGDRQIGKTALVVDIILNQLNEPKESRPICIYVAIGQKYSKVANIVKELEDRGALEHTIVVVAGAADPVPLWYIAPFAGCAMGEYFRDKGKDVVVIYDDLSKHAWAWRQISLLLRRPPGREAYPGDIFYLHSRLLERSAKLSKKMGGGSLTALPIVETQLGDISAYIPTNVISITDGQIYLETDLFFQGQRPAVNIGLSVSRVGSEAQTKAMKKVASRLKLELAQYQELAAFVQFSADLDEATRRKIERGAHLTELLRQDQYMVMPFEEQTCVLFAGISGLFDEIPIEKLRDFEVKFLDNLRDSHANILGEIRKTGDFSDKLQERVKQIVEEMVKSYDLKKAD